MLVVRVVPRTRSWPKEMPRLLELFSGTGSVGRVFAAAGWDVYSVDLDPKAACSEHCDVLAFEATRWPPGYWDMIWASPPCTHYSRARTTAKTPRDLWGSDALAQRTLDIIAYFQPRAWMIENPDSGLLKDREVVRGLPYVRTDYCCWGRPFRKRTRLWTNLTLRLPLCVREACPSMVGGRHTCTAQRERCSLDELHAIPPGLVEAVLAAVRSN